MHATAEEFFDSRIRLATVCPETVLMYAVLEDALFCFQGQLKPRARRAEEWFFSDDSKSLYSFVSICAALELQPEHIRMKLKRRDPTVGRGLRLRHNNLEGAMRKPGDYVRVEGRFRDRERFELDGFRDNLADDGEAMRFFRTIAISILVGLPSGCAVEKSPGRSPAPQPTPRSSTSRRWMQSRRSECSGS